MLSRLSNEITSDGLQSHLIFIQKTLQQHQQQQHQQKQRQQQHLQQQQQEIALLSPNVVMMAIVNLVTLWKS